MSELDAAKMAGQFPAYSGDKSLYLGWQWQKWMSINIL